MLLTQAELQLGVERARRGARDVAAARAAEARSPGRARPARAHLSRARRRRGARGAAAAARPRAAHARGARGARDARRSSAELSRADLTSERLAELWGQLSSELRAAPDVVALRALALQALGRGEEAEKELRAALKKNWQRAPVLAYGEVRGADRREAAEAGRDVAQDLSRGRRAAAHRRAAVHGDRALGQGAQLSRIEPRARAGARRVRALRHGCSRSSARASARRSRSARASRSRARPPRSSSSPTRRRSSGRA